MRQSAMFGLCAIALAACSFEDTRTDKPCDVDDDCESGNCYRGYCIRADSSGGGSGGRTGMMMSPTTSDGGAGRNAGMSGRGGNGGAAGSAGEGGASGTGTSTPDSGMNMSMPNAGTGGMCRDGETRACQIEGMASDCRAGEERCEDGRFGTCEALTEPGDEVCNGFDDNCDGTTDEDTAEDCYPNGMMGCTVQAGRSMGCEGTCTTGKRECRDGQLASDCTGAVLPKDEECGSSGAAADEDCDGAIDETCMCTSGETRACYTASSATIGVGKCKAGMQTCTNGQLGPCMGAVTPQSETCQNETADDNCDGIVDNILSRGARCTVASNMGVCRDGIFQCQAGRPDLACVTPMATPETCNGKDDDCNGMTDDTFNLQTDAANCGMCGKACAAGQSCCGGSCVDLKADATQCGMCGAACATGQSCCNGMCFDTNTDAMNCGMCGTACATGESCCGGKCVNPKTDAMHCGMCNTACTGTRPGCCDGACVDFTANGNCGECGKTCGTTTDGALCSCGLVDQEVKCIADLILCL